MRYVYSELPVLENGQCVSNHIMVHRAIHQILEQMTAIPALRRSIAGLTTASPLLSAVHRGVAFEERCLKILQSNLSMTLHRVGGKADGGVDLQGWWWLPTSRESLHHDHIKRRRLRVFAQCKAEKKKISPKYVREMEGVLLHHLAQQSPRNPYLLPAQDLMDPVVGMFLSSSPFTKATLLRATASPIPFMLLHVPESPDEEGESLRTPDDASQQRNDSGLGSIIFNPALGSSWGLLLGEVEARWEFSSQGLHLARPGLWWKGEQIPSWTPELCKRSKE